VAGFLFVPHVFSTAAPEIMSLTHTLVQIIDMKEFFLFKPTTNAEF
jgi:hypothetical protein